MSTPESVIIRAIHEAFIKYPEGDGGPPLDYDIDVTLSSAMTLCIQIRYRHWTASAERTFKPYWTRQIFEVRSFD